MKRLCFGTLLRIFYECKRSGSQNNICQTMLNVFDGSILSAVDAAVNKLKKGVDNVSPITTETARNSTYEETINKIEPLIKLIKPEKYISIIRAIKAVLREDTTIQDDTTLGYVSGYEKSKILASTTFTFNELIANILYYVVGYVSNRDCHDSLVSFETNFVSQFDTGETIYLETHVSEKLVPLKKVINDDKFNGVFTKACECTLTGLTTDSTVEFYMVSVNNFKFKFKDLQQYVSDHIGKYVFSRNKIDSIITDGRTSSLNLDAIKELMKTSKIGETWSNSTLGEILLFIFLENVLGAPKIMSKLEIDRATGGQIISKCDGVHLLMSQRGEFLHSQLVFGASDIVGNLKVAVDRALDKIIAIRDNEDSELQLVDNTIYDNIYDPETTTFLKNLLVPRSPTMLPPEMSFAAFLGYTVNVSARGLTQEQFRTAVLSRLQADIEELKPYVLQKIEDLGLEKYDLYIYVLPFNDAPNESVEIMNSII